MKKTIEEKMKEAEERQFYIPIRPKPLRLSDIYSSYLEDIIQLEKENKQLKEQLQEAKQALCEASRMALSDEKDISKIYDIVYPVIIKLNSGGV